MKRLQLATMQTRLDELERRAAGESGRALKERQRKQRQKAAKKAAAAHGAQQRDGRQQAAAPDPARLDEAQQLARAAQQHQQRSPATGVLGPDTGRRTDGEMQPALGPATTAPSAIQPAVPGGIFGSTRAAAGAQAPATAARQPASTQMDVVQPAGRTNPNQQVVQTFGAAPTGQPASQPAGFGGGFGSTASGATASVAAATKFRRTGSVSTKPQDAPTDDQVMYPGRPGGPVFGMAGSPGEKWAGGK